jgi:pectinesterase
MYYMKASEGEDLNRLLNSGSEGPLTVELPQKAVFRQKVRISRNDLTVIGNGATIVWNDHNGMTPGFGTAASATLTVTGNNVVFRDLTVQNDFDFPLYNRIRVENPAVRHGLQAVAVFTSPDSTGTVFESCTLLSWQDTLFCDGDEESYRNCVIEGNIDFIFGRSHAVFEHCTIVSLGKGFVTAPSTMADKERGLCFESCILTCTSDVEDGSVYLARPWHPSAKEGVCCYASFKGCKFGRHISRALWTTMHDSKGGTHTPQESRFSALDCSYESN